jgi:hypothetical protein
VQVPTSSKQPMQFEVQLKTNPYLTSTGSWGEPVPNCGGIPGSEVVYVDSDLKIKNNEQFIKWLNGAKHCSGKFVFWVKRSGSETRDTLRTEAGMYTVYDVLKDQVGDVVVSGTGGIPIRFAK